MSSHCRKTILTPSHDKALPSLQPHPHSSSSFTHFQTHRTFLSSSTMQALFHIVLFATSIQYPVPRLLTKPVSLTLRAQHNCRLFRETSTNTILPSYLVTCFFSLEYAA
ncbi:unnamed protein product [Rangifer tarandus platyrhynchus]|uniref:Uncharacterized protein n=1 Tax=Rangifer tarandus platyrhynchus TaxID=3082113 RepID=A0AC60A1U9_RANTA